MMASSPEFWLAVGFLGQFFFTARFLVQWAVSEKKCDSIVPVAFWWLSLLGGGTLLAYALHRRDPVIIVGQAMGVFVYTRNLMLVKKAECRSARRARLLKGISPILLETGDKSDYRGDESDTSNHC
jgi:lipid-A-disaccharide synthase-like uncharacterized protein